MTGTRWASPATTSSGDFSVARLPELTSEEFERFRKLAYEAAGLDLKRGKEQLVSARLGRKLRELNLSTYQDYFRHIAADTTGEALVALLDALTTNHTSFFREPAHFAFLRRRIVPELRGRSAIRIWSAACSSGEEPWSIAFALREEMGAEASKVRIVATDISTRVLDFAVQAVYPEDRFSDLPPDNWSRHLLKGRDGSAGHYRVRPEIRRMVEFRRVNLMENFVCAGQFEVIFCRNVMIYFDGKTQEDLVNRLAERLEPGGYLFIGHAESLNRIRHGLSYVQPAIYRKGEAGLPGRSLVR